MKSIKRHALVIGNSAYEFLEALPNAKRDAELVASKFESLGFQVALYTNADQADMEHAFLRFIDELDSVGGVDTAIFFFAGHGFQERGTNYLLPISGQNAGLGALPLQELVEAMAQKSSRRLVFLDACRDYLIVDVLKDSIIRSRGLGSDERLNLGRGLAEFDVDEDTFLSFSCSPGQVAYDGLKQQSNSPYARALSRSLEEVDLPLSVMMARVRNSILHDTNGRQKTWDSSTLKNAFFFSPNANLIILGNAIPLLASLFALATSMVVLSEASVSEFAGTENLWPAFGVSLGVYLFSLFVFLHGAWRTYGRMRGERSDWQVDGRFKLSRWSTAGSYGAIYGALSGVIYGSLVTVAYWYQWRTNASNTWLAEANCGQRHLLDPSLPPFCPRLGSQLLEGNIAAIFVLAAIGLSTMHLSEWMFRKVSPSATFLKRTLSLVSGSVLGGMIGGTLSVPFFTAYFGSQDRPFMELGWPSFVAPVAILIPAVCIVNYRAEKLGSSQIFQSIVGSVFGALSAFLLIALVASPLYVTGFFDVILNWANNGFLDGNLSTIRRFQYLMVAGIPYGVILGIGFGLLVGITRAFSEQRWRWRKKT